MSVVKIHRRLFLFSGMRRTKPPRQLTKRLFYHGVSFQQCGQYSISSPASISVLFPQVKQVYSVTSSSTSPPLPENTSPQQGQRVGVPGAMNSWSQPEQIQIPKHLFTPTHHARRANVRTISIQISIRASKRVNKVNLLLSHKNAAGSPLRKGWEESGSWELERKEKG